MTAPTCPRCGRDLVPLEQLAASAGCVAVLADRVRDGLQHIGRTIPQRVPNAVHELATAAPRLAEALECAAGICMPRSA